MEWNQELFVKNVRYLLKGQSQNSLNKVAGRDAVTRWKNGDRPSLEVLLKTKDFLKCSLDDLIYRDMTLLEKELETPQTAATSLEIALLNITHRLGELADRVKAQGNALQGLQDDCLKVKNDIQDIYKRMTDAAESKDVRKLKSVG